MQPVRPCARCYRSVLVHATGPSLCTDARGWTVVCTSSGFLIGGKSHDGAVTPSPRYCQCLLEGRSNPPDLRMAEAFLSFAQPSLSFYDLIVFCFFSSLLVLFQPLGLHVIVVLCHHCMLLWCVITILTKSYLAALWIDRWWQGQVLVGGDLSLSLCDFPYPRIEVELKHSRDAFYD